MDNESINTRQALKEAMEQLIITRNELEQRVSQRTAELELAKMQLEKRVAERTEDLDKARRATMHMLKDLREDMIKLQNLDRAKTEFLSMVSHELRTPLTPIKGYISLLLSEKLGPLSPPQKEAVKVLNRQSDDLQDLIGSLLDMTRLELNKPIPLDTQPLSVKELIAESIDSIRLLAQQRDIKIDQDIADNLPTIQADQIKLKRVLVNLVGNALKFTPQGGAVVVRALPKKNGVIIEVVDSGIGIPAEFLEKVFQKYFQIENSYTIAAGGLGMGLAISRELVELHGGKIWAESRGLDQGTKIVFTLPVGKGGN